MSIVCPVVLYITLAFLALSLNFISLEFITKLALGKYLNFLKNIFETLKHVFKNHF